MPIYTRFGDTGETRLFDGSRVPKHDLRVRAYGEIDELNSSVGVALTYLPPSEVHELLIAIQKHLMSVGASLASPDPETRDRKSRVQPEWVAVLEEAIDRFEEELPPLQRFILPGGSRAGAHLHLARTICRRAERLVAELAGAAPVEPVVLEYVNRLSDLLFVLARVANYREGTKEFQW